MKTSASLIAHPLRTGLAALTALALLAAGLSCTKEGPAGPAGPAGSGGTTALADPSITPAVISTTPAPNSTGPYDLYAPGLNSTAPHFVVVFNKLMDTRYIRAHPNVVRFSGYGHPVAARLTSQITSATQGPKQPDRLSTNGAYDNVLAFTLYDSLTGVLLRYPLGEECTITLSDSLKDINGNHPARAYSFSYTPEPYFRATFVNPAPSGSPADRGVTPSLTFNSRVDESITSALHISPPVAGTWVLRVSTSGETVEFQRAGPFSFNTLYTISADAAAHDTAGMMLGGPRSWTFRTEGFVVVATTPADGDTRVSPGVSIRMRFSDPISAPSFVSAFGITPGVPLAPTFYPDEVYLAPPMGFAPETRYTVTLSTSLSSFDGVAFDAPYEFSFTTDKFRVYSASPAPGSSGVYRTSYGYVTFNALIDTATARAAFHISPAAPLSLYLYNNAVQFYPVPSYAPAVTYTVTIDSTVRTMNGYPLLPGYQYSFTTGEQ